MQLERDLRRIAEAAVVHAAEDEEVAGIVPAEPAGGLRLYVCASAPRPHRPAPHPCAGGSATG